MAERSVRSRLRPTQGAAMSYKILCKAAEYFEDRARRAREPSNHERLTAVAKKYRLRARLNASAKRSWTTKGKAPPGTSLSRGPPASLGPRGTSFPPKQDA